jgi:F0F1-type ATP synthase membrane subunit a
MNLVGLVPYTFTPTAHLIVGFGLSVSIVIGVTVMGLDNYGSNYLAA